MPIVKIGKIEIGGGNPVAIQSMTDTDTADANATAAQCMELADAGSEMVRITVNNEAAAKAVPVIREILDSKGYEELPLIGDFHYNGHELLTDFPEMAKALDKYRINPGNSGDGFEKMIAIAIENDKAVRIGLNWGSTDKDMVQSVLESAAVAEKLGLPQNKIVLSAKMSDVQDLIATYKELSDKMGGRYALHLGLTEAGSGMQGVVSSAAALAILLQQGIGDTIRISITPEPGQARTAEVIACKNLLQSMGLRHFAPKITSCPGCGRTESSYFKELAKEINDFVDDKMSDWKNDYPGVEKMKVAVMGCIVNGPGESRHADIAIHLPGKNEDKMAPVYMDGKYTKTLTGEDIGKQFMTILEDYVKSKYGISNQ